MGFEIKTSMVSDDIGEQRSHRNAVSNTLLLRTPLDLGAPTLMLCASYPIVASPSVMRRSGTTRVLVSGLHGEMLGCLAVLVDCVTGNLLCEPVACVSCPDVSKGSGKEISVSTLTYSVAFDFNSKLSESVQRVLVCLTDSVTRWATKFCPVVSLFDRVVLKTPLKTKPGVSAQLVVSGIDPPDESSSLPSVVVVRLCLLPPSEMGDNGKSDASINPATPDEVNQIVPSHWIDVTGKLVLEQLAVTKGKKSSVSNPSPSTPQLKVTFSVPSLETLSTALPKVEGKSASLVVLFVGVSLDSGQSFDFSDKPILTVDIK